MLSFSNYHFIPVVFQINMAETGELLMAVISFHAVLHKAFLMKQNDTDGTLKQRRVLNCCQKPVDSGKFIDAFCLASHKHVYLFIYLFFLVRSHSFTGNYT